MEQEQKQNEFGIKESIVVSAVILVGAWIFTSKIPLRQHEAQVLQQANTRVDGTIIENVATLLEKTLDVRGAASTLEDKVLPPDGVVLPVRWGDLGAQTVSAGVIDKEQFDALLRQRFGEQNALVAEANQLLSGENNGNIKITQENSSIILNLLWALGLGNKNDILDNGPMTAYDGKQAGSPAEALAKAGRFASTGGWTLAQGDAMSHYSRHNFVVLTQEQQELVERTAKSIYRPCCGNSTYFPDCNHGMAMLGLLELMASQGVSEKEMYRAALQVNAYWFPDTYLTIAQYLARNGIDWNEANPKEILGYNYSSAAGYQEILKQVAPPATRSGGGCGV